MFVLVSGVCGLKTRHSIDFRCISYNISYNEPMDTRIRKIGNGYGVLLPKQIVDELRLEEGSVLSIVKDAEGIHLSPYDANFSEQLEAFRRTEAKHRNSYRELAK